MSDTPKTSALRVRQANGVYAGGMEREPVERTTREVREHLADIINAAIRGHVTYITNRGRRIAAIVPLTSVDQAAACDAPGGPFRPPTARVDDHEYDEGYEAAKRGDWMPSEVAAQSASWRLGYHAYEAAAKTGEGK